MRSRKRTRATLPYLEKISKTNLQLIAKSNLYDTLLMFDAGVPHEVAGFTGGAKYLFPGVAGPADAERWCVHCLEKLPLRLRTRLMTKPMTQVIAICAFVNSSSSKLK